jgi:acyl CoA:acetate/3-ketoacid CoA transferase alpha subunit
MLAGKSVCTADEAVADMKSGDMIAVGGFGTVRNRANQALDALARRDDVKDLVAVANGFPHQPLAAKRMVKKFIGAFGTKVQAASGKALAYRDGVNMVMVNGSGVNASARCSDAMCINHATIDPAFRNDNPISSPSITANGVCR